MDAICEPTDKVEVFISTDKKKLYVHVNGITVFRLGHIPDLVLDIPTTMADVKFEKYQWRGEKESGV